MTFTKALIIFALLVLSFNLLMYGVYRRVIAEAKRRAAEQKTEGSADAD